MIVRAASRSERGRQRNSSWSVRDVVELAVVVVIVRGTLFARRRARGLVKRERETETEREREREASAIRECAYAIPSRSRNSSLPREGFRLHFAVRAASWREREGEKTRSVFAELLIDV